MRHCGRTKLVERPCNIQLAISRVSSTRESKILPARASRYWPTASHIFPVGAYVSKHKIATVTMAKRAVYSNCRVERLRYIPSKEFVFTVLVRIVGQQNRKHDNDTIEAHSAIIACSIVCLLRHDIHLFIPSATKKQRRSKWKSERFASISSWLWFGIFGFHSNDATSTGNNNRRCKIQFIESDQIKFRW